MKKFFNLDFSTDSLNLSSHSYEPSNHHLITSSCLFTATYAQSDDRIAIYHSTLPSIKTSLINKTKPKSKQQQVDNPTLHIPFNEPINDIKFHYKEFFEKYSDEINDFFEVPTYRERGFQIRNSVLLATLSQKRIHLYNVNSNSASGKISAEETCRLKLQSECGSVEFNPVCFEVLGLSSGNSVKVMDIEKYTISDDLSFNLKSGDLVEEFKWRKDGKSIAYSSNKREVGVMDLRKSSEKLCSELCFEGSGKISVNYFGDNVILASGFSVERQRQMKVWDVRKMNQPLQTLRIDAKVGDFTLQVDHDSGLVFLMGRGGQSLRVYSLKGQETCKFLSQHTVSKFGSLGYCLARKSSLDIYGSEVVRLWNFTQRNIEAVRVQVPRKVDDQFYPELYPDTMSFLNGSLDLKGWIKYSSSHSQDVTFDVKKEKVMTLHEIILGVKQRREQEERLQREKNIEKLALEREKKEKMKLMERQKDEKLYKSKVKMIGYIPVYKNILIKDPKKNETLFNLPKISQNPVLAVSSKLFALVILTSGNAVLIEEVNRRGKLLLRDNDPNVIRVGKSPICMMQFSLFDDDCLVTGQVDGTIKVWKELRTKNVKTHSVSFHSNSVSLLLFHPSVKDLFVSASSNGELCLWDVNDTKHNIFAASEFEHLKKPISDACFNCDGKSLLTTDRSGLLILYELKHSKKEKNLLTLQKCYEIASGLKIGATTKVEWIGRRDSQMFLLSGFSGNSPNREVQLYSSHDSSLEFLQKIVLNHAPTVLDMFIVNEGMSFVLYSRGESLYRVFSVRIGTEATQMYHCKDISLALEQGGIRASACLPFRENNTEQFEVLNVLALRKSTLGRIKFYMPRSKEAEKYFADDLYPSNVTRSSEPVCSLIEFIHGDMSLSTFPKTIETLNHDDRELYSKRREERKRFGGRSRTRNVRDQREKQERINAANSLMMSKMAALANRKHQHSLAKREDDLSDESDWSE